MVRLCGCWLGKHSHTIIAIQSKYPIMGSMEIQFHWMESCAKLMFYTSHAYPPTKQKEKEKKKKKISAPFMKSFLYTTTSACFLVFNLPFSFGGG